MIFRKQLLDNDCFRTALGCLFDLEPHEVPDFVAEDGIDTPWSEEGKTRVRAWVKERGYDILDTSYILSGESLQTLLDHIRYLHGEDIMYMCAGKNKKMEPHVVICRGNEILWDTSPVDTGIDNPFEGGIYWIHYIAKEFMRYMP